MGLLENGHGHRGWDGGFLPVFLQASHFSATASMSLVIPDKVQNNMKFGFKNFELLYKNENLSCKFSFTKSTSSILKLCRKIIPIPYSLLYTQIFSDM